MLTINICGELVKYVQIVGGDSGMPSLAIREPRGSKSEVTSMWSQAALCWKFCPRDCQESLHTFPQREVALAFDLS